MILSHWKVKIQNKHPLACKKTKDVFQVAGRRSNRRRRRRAASAAPGVHGDESNVGFHSRVEPAAAARQPKCSKQSKATQRQAKRRKEGRLGAAMCAEAKSKAEFGGGGGNSAASRVSRSAVVKILPHRSWPRSVIPGPWMSQRRILAVGAKGMEASGER